MIKFVTRIFFVFISALFFIPNSELLSFAAESPASEQQSILAPEGLTSKEKADLERQYRYEFRRKDTLLTPYVSMPGAVEIAGEEELYAINEREKLYRYFGIATELYESGKPEEAAEILKYISYKSPDDEYVKNFLKKVSEEAKKSKTEWAKNASRDAKILKDKQIKDLAREGIDYYRNKNFEAALLKFSDALSLDAQNNTAKTYMEKLKKYYLMEMRAEDIAQQQQSESPEENTQGETLNEPSEGEVSVEPAQDLSEDERFEQIISSKKTKKLIEGAEFEAKVQEIIQQQREIEKRSRSFTLGPGDIVQINVRDHPELSGRVTVNLNGGMPLPLTGDVIMARDLSLEELNARVSEIMKRYVKEPQVNITLIEYRSKLFYVVDEIGTTPYPIPRPNFTLRDALFVSDWGDNRALGRVLIVKPSKLHPVVKTVNAFDLIYRGNLLNNVRIENGDVIYVPQTYVGKANQFLIDTFAPITAISQGTAAANDAILDIRKLKGQEMKKIKAATIYGAGE